MIAEVRDGLSYVSKKSTHRNCSGRRSAGQRCNHPSWSFDAAGGLLLKRTGGETHPSATMLPDRALLIQRLAERIAVARRSEQKMAVLFLDLNSFRHINDSLGYTVGDRLLQSVAQRLLACVRDCDVVGRLGGDEFAILLADVAHAHDAVVAERVLAALHPPYCIDGHVLHITASLGLATYPDDGEDAEALLKSADLAMRHGKDNSLHDSQFYSPEMNRRALKRHALQESLRNASEQHEFALHYQPVVNLRTGAITGVEALLRCWNPARGLHSPAEFIPVAEECGLIVQIGRWVLGEACRQARAWRDSGLSRICVAINVSTLELRRRGFVANVCSVLRDTGLEPGCLELELTETFLLQDQYTAVAVLRSLHDLGVRLSLDDFGTGYSSLSHLKRFPIDALKIDQSFVRGLPADEADANIVSAIVAMGRSLQVRVTAEGIETSEQLSFLMQRSCSLGQGFLLGRPMEAEAIGRLLRDQESGALQLTEHPAADVVLARLARIHPLGASGLPL